MSNQIYNTGTALPTTIEDMAPSQEHSFVAEDHAFDPTNAQLSDIEKEMKQQAGAQQSIPVPVTDAVPAAPTVPVGFRVKPPISKLMSAAQFVQQAQETDAALIDAMASQVYKSNAGAQVLSKSAAPIVADPEGIDWTKITERDIYNDNIPIQAKPFAADDSLRIVLKDQNYAARWVNKNPILLGKAISAGFTYITKNDLGEPLDVAITEDVNGQFINLDVIAMKCPKRIYFAALKAAFRRAVNSVNALSSRKAAKKQAMDMLIKQAGSGATEEFEAGKISFYDAAGIEI